MIGLIFVLLCYMAGIKLLTMHVIDLNGNLMEVKDVEGNIRQLEILAQFVEEKEYEKAYWQHLHFELLKLKQRFN